MKRTLLLALLAFCANVVFGQTNYFKYVYSVDKDTGVKSKAEAFVKEGGIYITFTEGGNYCYRSDKDGFKTQFGGDTYRYIGTNNGRHTYYFSLRDTGNPFMKNYPKCYYYFSSDYSRLNIWSDCSDMNFGSQGSVSMILVYERASAPEQRGNAPDQLW